VAVPWVTGTGTRRKGLADYKFITLVPIPILGEKDLLILLLNIPSS
jgi:hypothetical protein